MTTANEIKSFVSAVDLKFIDSECNLTSNKLEYINLVHLVEDQYKVELSDSVLNRITNIQELVEEISLALHDK